MFFLSIPKTFQVAVVLQNNIVPSANLMSLTELYTFQHNQEPAVKHEFWINLI